MSGNTITIVGNATRDPELRFTASGQARASFGVAVSRRWQNRQTNEWEESTSFFNVNCWRELAENVAESIHKGSRVVVTGRLEQRSWETNEGEKRSVIEIEADEIAPSLRYATAQVTRNERRDGGFDGGSGGGGRNDGGGRPDAGNRGGSNTGSSGGSSPRGGGPAATPPASSGGGASYEYDEEPF
jgi:single-strand DNA-binding protein